MFVMHACSNIGDIAGSSVIMCVQHEEHNYTAYIICDFPICKDCLCR